MSGALGFGLIAALVYLPAACLITLGVLAVWNSWRPPKLWQVIVATVVVVFIPTLVRDLNDLVYDLGAPNAGYRIRLAFSVALLSYIPVLVPAVLWALQRRGSNGQFSKRAQIAGSLLVGYVVLVILVLPAAFAGFVFYFGGSG